MIMCSVSGNFWAKSNRRMTKKNCEIIIRWKIVWYVQSTNGNPQKTLKF